MEVAKKKLTSADAHQTKHRLIHLDMLRGIAALGVVLGHSRSFTVLDYASSGTDSPVVQAFYLFTGLGHQWVLAFFALSGFLVGGPAFRAILHGDWNWERYMIKRLTRLWIVLIPALLLTLGLDTAGEILGGSAGYTGSFYGLISSGPSLASPADLSLTTLAANLVFLQTIVRPTFGSNGPLWSLANEFWYYVTFPFLLFAAVGRQWGLTRVVMGAIGFALIIFLPTEMVMLGSIWVAGAIAQYALETINDSNMPKFRLGWAVTSVVAVVVFTLVDKRWPGIPADICLGIAFACLLPALTTLPDFGVAYDIGAKSLSKISYTLYATHFPVLAFIWFVILAPHQWPVGGTATLLIGLFITLALLVSIGMWWLFERNTDRVRRFLELSLFQRTELRERTKP